MKQAYRGYIITLEHDVHYDGVLCSKHADIDEARRWIDAAIVDASIQAAIIAEQNDGKKLIAAIMGKQKWRR